MCAIIVCLKKKPKPKTVLKVCFSNPVGRGIAWISNGQVHWKKGQSVDELIADIALAPLPFVVHVRIASNKANTIEFCQPFPIEQHPSLDQQGQGKSVIFHQGPGFKDLDDQMVPEVTDENEWTTPRAIAHGIGLGLDFESLSKSSPKNKFVIVRPEGISTFGQFFGNEILWSKTRQEAFDNAHASMKQYCQPWDHPIFPKTKA
jgi:hypothetical protein